MNEETIYDQNEVKENQMDDCQNNESGNATEKKKKGVGTAAAAGVAGAAGIGLGVLLSPKLVFPNNPDEGEGDTLDSGDVLGEEEAMEHSGHLTGHNMDMAHGVNDSMSFNQAFAAARQEVGPGGLFVWHGHTYGTYYKNEWDSMSAEDKEQYWSDVHHTTSSLNEAANETPTEPVSSTKPNEGEGGAQEGGKETVTEPMSPTKPNEEEGAAQEGGKETVTEPVPPTAPSEEEGVEQVGSDEKPTEDPTQPEAPVEGIGSNGEEYLEPAAPEPLVLSEDEVIVEFDLDGNGIPDTAIVDANGNDIADVIVDTTGDGNYDTLVIDPELDNNGELVVADENVVEIGGVQIEEDVNLALDEVEDPSIYDSPEYTGEGSLADNPDVDDFASLTPDPDITIDNDMDMSDFA